MAFLRARDKRQQTGVAIACAPSGDRRGAQCAGNAKCLPQAMAAKAMLARRGCGSSFHLGAGFDARGKLIAHAWLVSGGTIVVGAAGIAGVTPLARLG